KFANTLKAAGVPDAQAEAQATAFAEVIQLNFKELVTKDDLDRLAKATKDDLAATKTELKQEFDAVEQRLNAKIEAGEQRLDAKIDPLDARVKGDLLLVKWMLGATFTGVVAAIGLLARLLFILPR